MAKASARVLVTTDVLYRTKVQPVRNRMPALAHVLLARNFTSGTTGAPKAAMHVHEAVVAHYETARFALDLDPGDRFWCTANPGWIMGTSYGIIAPLTHGLTVIADEADFDAERWYRIIQDGAPPSGTPHLRRSAC